MGASCQCGTHSVDLEHGLVDCGQLGAGCHSEQTRCARGVEDPGSSLEEIGISFPGDPCIQAS